MVGQGLELDLDRLLWIPNQKKIFLPSLYQGIDWGKGPYYSEIVNIEMIRMLPRIRGLFERDDIFYRTIRSSESRIISSDRDFTIPLIKGN